ncbi:hypothetical protein [Thiohalocapsa sp. ML1]|uniref:hypothetical protein n=1 Tax=Thiohalocapsa sp. ML1 TaxID=1431688 RepID=UPI0012E33257|nr:hypothetical protein [Thiohalocapsa sp. ML1]
MKPVVRRPRGPAAGAPPAFFVAVAATAAGRSGDRAPFGPNSSRARSSACGSRKPSGQIVGGGYITGASAAASGCGGDALECGRGGMPVRTMRIGAPQQRQRS